MENGIQQFAEKVSVPLVEFYGEIRNETPANLQQKTGAAIKKIFITEDISQPVK
ncbi:MAG: hypothetical protein HY864_18905 [Chloroflexi bacterium]|nr:hypothetical protein [Chloroflexota bacterium]